MSRSIITLWAFVLISFTPALAATVPANFTSASSIPLIEPSYNATGNDVAISLGFAPPTGTNLTVVKNTGLAFITAQFSNLAHGQAVDLSYNGITYKFVVNYYGGSGNDLVLHWAYQDLAAWGNNSNGELGNNSTTNSTVPASVSMPKNAILSSQTVVAIAAGGSHNLALCSGGTVVAWGLNSSGQLGNNSTTNSSVRVLVPQGGILSGKISVAVAAGGSHSLSLCSDGTVAAWGLNGSGQLGNNSTANRSVPVLVTQSGVLSGKIVVAIAAGGSHSLALCADGSVAAWGGNSYGQLGNNSRTDSSVPVLVTQSGILADKTVVAITAGWGHSLALCSDGSVATWGNNFHGQLGNNSSALDTGVPVLVTQSGILAGKTVVKITAGSGHSLALCSDGAMAAWGYNYYGELGNNSTTQSSVPVLVTQSGALFSKTVVAVAAGSGHTLALCSDGTVAAWGHNYNGQLGYNNTAWLSSVPVLVTQSGVLSVKAVVAVAAGLGTSLALAAVENSAELASLTSSYGIFNPIFDPANTSYGLIVPNATSSITLTPTSKVNCSTIRVNGVIVTSSGTSPTIPLSVGANTITVQVTAPDGISLKTYTVIVIRISSESTLSGLEVSSGTLSPAFVLTTKDYSVSVTSASLAVTPTVTDSTATVKVNGVTVDSGSPNTAIQLTLGNNTITVLVTAEDGATLSTYTVTVTRQASSEATLSGIVLTTGTQSPAFSSAITSYSISVSNATASLKISPSATSPSASVKVNGAAVVSGSASPSIPLSIGPNTITVLVTAQDGSTTKTYTILVTRAASSVATLKGLSIKGIIMSPKFKSATTAYTAGVNKSTTSIKITPTATHTGATIKVNGTTIKSGSLSKAIPLKTGKNTIKIVVTAQNGTAKTYKIVVTRSSTAASAPKSVAIVPSAKLAEISPSYQNNSWTTKIIIGGRAYLQITAKKEVPAVSYMVEVSPNLIDWFSGDRYTTALVDDITMLRARDNTPITPGSKRYIRVRTILN